MANQPDWREGGVAAWQGLKILIVEDHPGTQRAMQLLLRWLRCDADTVNNGREAVEAVRGRDYDLVFMDVLMPVMDGWEATRRIRAGGSIGTRPRIVGMSADTMSEDREVCFSAGMDGFLAKPLEVDALVRALDEAAAVLTAAC
jgi:two-component system sensor histidine kinase/response regulator